MDVVLHGLAGGFRRGLEQRPEIDIEADIGEGGGDHLGPPIVAVLAELDHQHARPAAVIGGKVSGFGLDRGEARITVIGGAIDPGNGADLGPIAAEGAFQGLGSLAHGSTRPARLDGQGQQIALAALRGQRQRRQGRLAGGFVALCAQFLEACDLGVAHGVVIDAAQARGRVLFGRVFIDPDDDFLAPIDTRLAFGGAFLDAQLGHALLDGLGHAAQSLNLLDQRPGVVGEASGQALHVVAAGERVDDPVDAGFLDQDKLGVAGHPGGGVRRQG